MVLQDIPMTLLAQGRSFSYIKGMVAKVLLEYARGIATMAGADWEMVHMSLKSRRNEGAIRIERHRIIVNKELLQKVAGVAGSVQSKGG